MKQEYVFRILNRDPSNPLSEGTIFEFGVSDPEAFANAIKAFAEMMKLQGTPEKTVAFMQRNKEAAKLKKLITGS